VTDDGRVRCSWATGTGGPADELNRDYHDYEWGRPVHGRDALFERICLEAFQSGLSWITILRKRESFRSAFAGFDPDAVARFTEADTARLMADASIVRNRAKIDAAVNNARAVLDLEGTDLDTLLWSFAPDPPRPRPEAADGVQAISAESTAMAKDLKRRGFRFVGPTTAHALMQATGMIDEHVAGCWVPPSASGSPIPGP
jgi:DNA-3-methyladenine glycosylase I